MWVFIWNFTELLKSAQKEVLYRITVDLRFVVFFHLRWRKYKKSLRHAHLCIRFRHHVTDVIYKTISKKYNSWKASHEKAWVSHKKYVFCTMSFYVSANENVWSNAFVDLKAMKINSDFATANISRQWWNVGHSCGIFITIKKLDFKPIFWDQIKKVQIVREIVRSVISISKFGSYYRGNNSKTLFNLSLSQQLLRVYLHNELCNSIGTVYYNSWHAKSVFKTESGNGL